MKKHILLFLGILGALTSAKATDVLRQVSISGTRRIENATVMNYLRMSVGDVVTDADLDAATKTLFATGLFSDVRIQMNNGVADIKVVENPIVHEVFFEGNKALSADVLMSEVMLNSRDVFTQHKLQRDAARLVELYKRHGRFSATVEPKIIYQSQNRIDIVFEVQEGPKALVKKINFMGNTQFSDSELKTKLMTVEKAWYRFMTNMDTYDPDRFNYDQELLRRFYLQEGYMDFKVTQAMAELLPDKSGFVLTLNVDEGQRYHYGDIEVKVHLPDCTDAENLQKEIALNKGETFNVIMVEETVDALTERLINQGYAFVEVTPDIRPNREMRTADITFNVGEGDKVFVRRINIRGNTRTLDKVVRREFRIQEGDAFNAAKLRQSKQRVTDLDYFGQVEMGTSPVAGQPSLVDMNMDLSEKSTGAFNIGVGWSSYDGMIFETGIVERNILGTGKILNLNMMLAEKETQYTIGWTNPYFMDLNVMAGVDFFHTTRDNKDSSSYSYDTTGGTVRFGWNYTDRFRHNARYTLRQDDITDVDYDASTYIKEQEGTNVVSMIGQELIYDRRDSRINPTTGYYTSLGADFAGVGGDSQFIRFNLMAIKYFPLADDVVLSLRGDAGRIWGWGGEKIRINDRYFLGDVSLRGFEYGGVGARDNQTNDALGGKWYATASVETTFPLGLPREMGIKGKVFSDVGVIGKPDNYDANRMDYSSKPRVSVGTGILWQSPMGMINLDFSWPVVKADEDETQVFRLNFGKGF